MYANDTDLVGDNKMKVCDDTKILTEIVKNV